jgi:hypothetical protein
MGVVYKLKPKIREFILEKKKTNPNLSCRKFADLILKKFKIKVSKSSINLLLKGSGLSMPVGRRRKRKRAKQEVVGLAPLLFLKAADHLLGATHYINELIKNRLNFTRAPEIPGKTEALLFSFLIELMGKSRLNQDQGLEFLPNQQITPEVLSAYLNELQGVRLLATDMQRIFSSLFQEVRCVKVSLLDGANFFFDGQLHTVWSTPQIPYDFSTTIYNIKSYIKRYLQENNPFMLFMAPAYDTPTKEFFDFLLSLESGGRNISRLTLYGNKFEELENLPLSKADRHFFIFGLWPWQYVSYRKVNTMGEFQPFYFEPLSKDFYLANVEIELLQPNVNKRVTLKGCALKRNLAEKVRLLILSNTTPEMAPEELAKAYLNHWPNLEEAFQDFSRKIELFTYTASSQRFFSTERLSAQEGPSPSIKGLFEYYLRALDLYLHWHFQPCGSENSDFSTLNELFFNLPCRLKKQKDYCLATLQLPPGFKSSQDLEYVCRRINEREVILLDGRRLWLTCQAT